VILDITSGAKSSGLDLLEPIKKAVLTSRSFFSGIGLDEKTLQEARQKGAAGYLNKTQPLDQMWGRSCNGRCMPDMLLVRFRLVQPSCAFERTGKLSVDQRLVSLD